MKFLYSDIKYLTIILIPIFFLLHMTRSLQGLFILLDILVALILWQSCVY